MKTRLGGVYQLQCLVNGKRYVGSTKDFTQRLRQHKSTLKKKKGWIPSL